MNDLLVALMLVLQLAAAPFRAILGHGPPSVTIYFGYTLNDWPGHRCEHHDLVACLGGVCYWGEATPCQTRSPQ